MTDADGNFRRADYDNFRLADSATYALQVIEEITLSNRGSSSGSFVLLFVSYVFKD